MYDIFGYRYIYIYVGFYIFVCVSFFEPGATRDTGRRFYALFFSRGRLEIYVGVSKLSLRRLEPGGGFIAISLVPLG